MNAFDSSFSSCSAAAASTGLNHGDPDVHFESQKSCKCGMVALKHDCCPLSPTPFMRAQRIFLLPSTEQRLDSVPATRGASGETFTSGGRGYQRRVCV